MLVRLQKHIADLGITSRRKAEVLIADGKVTVNGKIVNVLGTKIDPALDTVAVTEHELAQPKNNDPVYIALHKPPGYITSTTSEQGQSVMDLLTPENNIKSGKRALGSARVYPVGRLDKESEGLVLMTNDGELTNLLTHPKHEHEKEYEVTITQALSRDAEKVLKKGMVLGEERVGGIKLRDSFRKGKQHVVTVVLKEGKNRQIRRMFGRLGYEIISLKRTRIGRLGLGVLPVGRWKFVKKDNIA